MAVISLFWNTTLAAGTSCENVLLGPKCKHGMVPLTRLQKELRETAKLFNAFSHRRGHLTERLVQSLQSREHYRLFHWLPTKSSQPPRLTIGRSSAHGYFRRDNGF